jgi:predicted AlkP superfamily phosphohydrolase/phosphomutase
MRRLVIAPLILAGLVGGCSDSAPQRFTATRRLVILGVDGMDPNLLERYMREGRMPNLEALGKRGTYMRLGTTFPPQSPVAWSTFTTGMHPGSHGIYDFVHRDPHALGPYLSTSRTEPPETWNIGSLALPSPLSAPTIELLRGGRAFWQDLEDHRVPATMVKVPANFPPTESEVNESMAGMGTPDLLGTPGIFQLFTDAPRFKGGEVSGGIIHVLDFGNGHQARARLQGPPDPMVATPEPITIDVEILRDPAQDVALVRLGDVEHILQPGEWTEWIPVQFDPGFLSGALTGMVRLMLAEVHPHLRLYVSPINIDPLEPVMPLSAPADYVTHLAEDVGRFYTQGMPENTKALAAGVLTDDEFLEQADLVFQESVKQLDRELDRFQGGVLFFYFSSVDLLSHAFWRSIEPDARPEDAQYAHVLPDLYARIDGVVGRVLERVGPETDIIVMSDHGFTSYRYKVHLNTWLAQHSYLSVLPPDEVKPGPLGHIDWENTQAYALGLNQLFINLEGRETHGVVPRDEYGILVDRLARQLEGLLNPEDGARVVTEAARPDPSAFPDRAPDLIIGYNRGYRSSDESALGQVGDEIIERNHDKWSGDHCMHPSHVPGVLITNRTVTATEASLYDLAPTILAYFGITQPEGMTGKALWSLQE